MPNYHFELLIICYFPECTDGLYLFNGICVTSCPHNYFPAKELHQTKWLINLCSRCHYTCKRCVGPNDNECTECYSDAQLYRNGHCYAEQLLQEIRSLEKWYSAVAVVFLSLCFVILILVIYILTDKNPSFLCCSTKRTYNGLPLHSNQHSNVLNVNKIKDHRTTYHDNFDQSEDEL